MRPLREISKNFEQRGHRVLLSTLLLMIFISPFFQQTGKFQWLLVSFMILMLLAAVHTVANQARQYHVALVLGVLALVPQFGVLIDRAAWLETLRYVATICFLFWVCALLLRDLIVRSHTVTIELLFGAINIYLMAGIAFAFLYGLVEHV